MKPTPTADANAQEIISYATMKILDELGKVEKLWARDTMSLRHHLSIACSAARIRLLDWIVQTFNPRSNVWAVIPTLRDDGQITMDRFASDENPTSYLIDLFVTHMKAAVMRTYKRPTGLDAAQAELLVDTVLNMVKQHYGFEEAVLPSDLTSIGLV